MSGVITAADTAQSDLIALKKRSGDRIKEAHPIGLKSGQADFISVFSALKA